MSNELVQFNWSVPDHGYRWVRARSNDQSPEPKPLGPDASDEEQRTYEIERWFAAPRLYLTDGVPLGQPLGPVRITQPLKDCSGRLHRYFAKVQPTPDGILEFANNFGCLGGDIRTEISVREDDKNTQQRGEGEREWAGEIANISRAVRLWDMAREEKTEELASVIHWDDKGVALQWEEERSYKLIATDLYHTGRLNLMRRGDLVTPAMLLVQEIVNTELSNRPLVSPRLLWNTDTKQLEQHLVPNSLIGAIWLDFTNAINGNVPYRRCIECGDAFPVSPKAHRKQFCSAKCRIAKHRRDKKAREGSAK